MQTSRDKLKNQRHCPIVETMEPFRMSFFRPTILFLLSLTYFATAVGADGPKRLLPFQGHLTRPKQGNQDRYEPVPNGTYTVLVSLYTTPEGGQGKVWGPERHADIPVINGLANLLIGSKDAFPSNPDFFAKTVFVGVTIDTDNDPATADLELVPRQQYVPALYAHHAGTANDAKAIDGNSWITIEERFEKLEGSVTELKSSLAKMTTERDAALKAVAELKRDREELLYHTASVLIHPVDRHGILGNRYAYAKYLEFVDDYPTVPFGAQGKRAVAHPKEFFEKAKIGRRFDEHLSGYASRPVDDVKRDKGAFGPGWSDLRGRLSFAYLLPRIKPVVLQNQNAKGWSDILDFTKNAEAIRRWKAGISSDGP
ncbi:hypothetical protein [Aporhodopirellula aestuarii]|uniref:Uncharacterized protein n=1 Tax=Aporhodopirellula aestuarii TaxID=2950107 RepID=A0ABT0UEQ4_9BACT|nr:hypothetical protein [Aporhodopirellula aestuarii]MCM2374711.1 hypothetical protein [Aporhodopirellula aestuarii]